MIFPLIFAVERNGNAFVCARRNAIFGVCKNIESATIRADKSRILPQGCGFFFIMIRNIDRALFNKLIGSADGRKALAFAIYMKNTKATSIVKNWSYRELARLSNLSVATCQRRIATLRKLHFVDSFSKNGISYLQFKKLKKHKVRNKKNTLFHTPRNCDVKIDKFSLLGVKEIEKALMAQEIVEITIRKQYVERLIQMKTEPKRGESPRKIRRAMAICRKRGYDKFEDGGLSYKTISKRLHCSAKSVSSIIKFGEGHEMFEAHKCKPILIKKIIGGAKFALEYLDFGKISVFATNNGIYRTFPNRYSLCPM